MKKSDLIKKLQTSLEEIGDEHFLYVKLTRLTCTDESYLCSHIRKNKDGTRARMNLKEFEKYCLDNPIKQKDEGKK